MSKVLDRVPAAPGETLRQEYLKPLGISQEAFARHLGISRKTVNEIISGKSRITAAIALLLADALGTRPSSGLIFSATLIFTRLNTPRVVGELRAWIGISAPPSLPMR